jgi:hypothetical protein
LYCYKTRQLYQGKRIEDPEISPDSYSLLILNKGVQNMHWRKESGSGKTGYPHEETRFLSFTYTKTNSKWIKALNTRPTNRGKDFKIQV